MNVTLIRIDAADASGGALPVFLASHDVPEACHLGGDQWEPALAQLPDFALDFFGGAFAGQVTAPRTGFAVATTGLAAFAATPSARARFADARVRIWHGDITSAATVDLGPLTLRFDGRIANEPAIDDAARTASFEAAVQDSWADKPLLALFAGTGGIEGPADLTGQVKPLVLGNARLCGGVLIDRVDNVWMVSNGPVQAVNAAYDRLASLGASTGNYASLAALKAASIPNGSWGTCLALGLVRFGAPPDGRVSFDVSGSNTGTGGYVRLPGAIIRRIAELAGGTVNAASLTALDSARPYNLALQLREQVTAREAIAQIADSVGAVAGVSLRGELFAQALSIGTPSDTLAADDTSAQRVAATEELAKAAPSWRLATEAELTFEVHSTDEIAFEYRWQGEYSAARVYRIDDVVTGPDGAAWVYVNATPAAGQALPVFPVTSNAWWQVFQRAAAPIPSGNLADRPATGTYVGQPFAVLDRGEVSYWTGGSGWVSISDVTAVSQREIVPQFPIIEVRQGEAGHTGNRIVTHTAKRGTAALIGGTWSLPGQSLGAGTASVNSTTGAVTLSGIVQSGSYTIRYTHSDGLATDLAVNVTYIPSTASNPAFASGAIANFASSAFAAVTSVLQIVLPGGVTSATLTAANVDLSLLPEAPDGSTTAEFKWQRETSPGSGSWVDVGSVATSSPSPAVSDTGLTDGLGTPLYTADPGLVTCTRTASGLTAGSTQNFRLVARVSAGNVRTVLASGTASASA